MRHRFTHYLFLLVMVIVVNFLLPRAMPGSPVKTLMGEDAGALTAAEKMGILSAYDLDKPLGVQFLLYLKNLFTLNWGSSYVKRQPVLDLIASRVGWTLLLAGSSLVLSTAAGTLLGVCTAFRRRSGQSAAALALSAAVSSMPPFWVAVILLSIFGVRLGWFPVYGAYSMWRDYAGLAAAGDVLRHLALPLTAMVLTSFLTFFTTARYGALRVLSEDYIKLARMRGIPPGRITRSYVVRNTFIPVFTVVMMDVGYLLSGSVVIETVFSYPGLGTLMQEAVRARDYPLVQYTFLTSSVLTIAALLLADLLHGRLDPRMEAGGSE